MSTEPAAQSRCICGCEVPPERALTMEMADGSLIVIDLAHTAMGLDWMRKENLDGR